MSTVANAYVETQVMTASPERLHLMVVDAAIRFARQGEMALAAGDHETAFHALTRGRSCLNEIVSGISAEPNPELAERLKALFLFVHVNLSRADLLHDAQLVRDALAILETHRQTWLEVLGRMQREHAAPSDMHEGSEHSWTT